MVLQHMKVADDTNAIDCFDVRDIMVVLHVEQGGGGNILDCLLSNLVFLVLPMSLLMEILSTRHLRWAKYSSSKI